MTHLESLNILIDKASEIAGSDYKLAQQLGVGRQTVSNWRHGRKTATPADQAILAHVAGLDPVVTLARATVEQHEGKAKGDQLMRALGKALLVTGGVMGSAGASAAAILGGIATSPSVDVWARFTQCILC
jgi:plasmid maintenance system antidote protein VapI